MRLKRKSVDDFDDIVGKQFGYLTVIKYLYSEPNKQGVGNHHWYESECKCGNIKISKRRSLLKSEVKSCGCLAIETSTKQGYKNRKRSIEDSFMHSIYKTHLNQANYRKLPFLITEEQHKKLIIQNCHYCGIPPSNTFKRKWLIGEMKYNGMDRKDGNKGYEIDNLVTCCLQCNKAKNTMNYQEFKDYINRLINFNQ